MSAAGWIFMIGSLSFVWGLAGWCYSKVLGSGPSERSERSEPH